MKVTDVSNIEAASFYHNYINFVNPNLTIIDAFTNGLDEMTILCEKISEQQKEKYKYLPEKWSVQDVLLHVIDAERIFCYRALCISRSDVTHFPGFEENDYVANAGANNRTLKSLLEEFYMVRNATVALFKNLNAQQLTVLGTASNNPISVRALGFIIVGHFNHHLQIITDRYLSI